jgi:hypothetical protein
MTPSYKVEDTAMEDKYYTNLRVSSFRNISITSLCQAHWLKNNVNKLLRINTREVIVMYQVLNHCFLYRGF